jgi:formate dehydrogenase major subunit
MKDQVIRFFLDGAEQEAQPGETIWEVASRTGNRIPHLCHKPDPGYRPDGNCRACMVEIEGERVLAASCIRKPTAGMKVETANPRIEESRRMIFDLLMADQPPRDTSHDPVSSFWVWADKMGVETSRFDHGERPPPDSSHPAMRVFLDACIHCNLCVRACREVQVNDVIGMAFRGNKSQIVFDADDPMGASTCVGCGECVQACPTGALVETSLVDDQGVAKQLVTSGTDSVCPYCGVGCQVRFKVSDNRIVSVEGRNGPSNENRLCVKGRFGMDYVTHPHRLTKPLVRRDDAPKSGTCEVDPASPGTHFREATWEEALDLAASGLRKIRDKSSGDALAGFGSAKGSNEEAYLFQKLVRSGFGTNNVDHCTRLCHASSVAALLEGIGSGAVTAPFTACKDSDVIVVIGANPNGNHPVAASFFKQAVRRGAKLIVMDPRGTALRRYATHMLQFTPGTDVALLNALLNTIIAEELWDERYVERFTEGFDNLKQRIGKFTPEAMAPVCGIDAQVLRDVARVFAMAKSAIIFWGMGISQHTHGTDNARCLIALATITGNVGRPGTGLHPLRGQNNVQGASDAGLIPMMLPDYGLVDSPDVRTRFEDAWGTSLDPKRGLTVVEIMDAIHADQIHGMYIMGENPAMSDPDVQHARAALAKLDHLVVQDLFVTETAYHADVILPASAWPEKDGTVTNTNRQVQMGRKALEMPGDARQDWWILQQVANRMGLAWSYDHPRDVFGEMTQLMPSLANISWDRLMAEDAVTYPCDAADVAGNSIVFGDGFPRAGGRALLVPAEVTPPDEVPDEDYPLVLSTGRQLEHWHTGAMTRRTAVLDQLEPEAVASLSPQQLEALEISPGDTIRIVTRRGTIELKARADDSMPRGMIFVPFCYAEAAANTLTNPKLDAVGKIPEFKFCAARVEKSADAGALRTD